MAAVVRGLGCCQRLKATVDSVLLLVYSLPIVTIGRGIEGRAMATERRSTGCRLDAVLSLMFVELVLIFVCLLAAACDVAMAMASEMLVGLLGSIDATLGCCRGLRNSARLTTSCF